MGTSKKKPAGLFSFTTMFSEADTKKLGITILTSDTKLMDIPYRIPFKNVALQKATGGWQGGVFNEISGDSQSGKSFLAYELIAEAQKMGGGGVLFDTEGAYETAYGDIVGINQTDGTFMLSLEQDIDKIFKLIYKTTKEFRAKVKKKSVPLIFIIDSFPGLQTKVDLANMEAGKDPRGFLAMQKNAKFIDHVGRIIPFLKKAAVNVTLLNQITIDYTVEYGDNKKSNGEQKIKFYTTQRLRGLINQKVIKTRVNKESDPKVIIGSVSKWTTIKNRGVKPFQEVIVKILYARGMRKWWGLEELLLRDGLIRFGTTNKDANGNESKKKLTVFKPLKGENKDKAYHSIRTLCDENPSFLTPFYTGTYDDGEGDLDDEDIKDVPENDESDSSDDMNDSDVSSEDESGEEDSEDIDTTGSDDMPEDFDIELED